jgi:hypothetical protein
MVTHACNSNTWESETGGSGVQGESGLHSKTLSQKQKLVLTKRERQRQREGKKRRERKGKSFKSRKN